MYVLNLDKNNRVLSAGKEIEGIDYTGQTLVETLPDLSNNQWTEDYIYNGDGTYTYSPVERPPDPESEPSGEYVTYDELAQAIREGVNSYGQ